MAGELSAECHRFSHPGSGILENHSRFPIFHREDLRLALIPHGNQETCMLAALCVLRWCASITALLPNESAGY